jgi:hypothetical protein
MPASEPETEPIEGDMPVNSDHAEHSDSNPLIGEADVIGLYPVSQTAASKRTTTIDLQGNQDDD